VTDLDLFDTSSTGDLFEDAERPPEYGVRGGRYRFPPPPGAAPNPRGWMRCTNLASAFSDQRALQLWLERVTLLGLLAHDGVLFDELAALPDEQLTPETLEVFAEKARVAAGGDKGARKGTARHLMLEGYLNTGAINGHRRMIMQFRDLLSKLEEHELDIIPGWSERVVWHPLAGGVMGRMDARVMCRRTGQAGVLDLKTQRRFWTYQEACAQQYIYDSAPWVWEGPEGAEGRWVPYATRRRTADRWISTRWISTTAGRSPRWPPSTWSFGRAVRAWRAGAAWAGSGRATENSPP
jgi:hypothetical protein